MMTRKHSVATHISAGTGTAIALPVLDAMTPAFAIAGRRPLRMLLCGWRSPMCRTASS